MLRDRSLVPLSRQHHHGLALCVRTARSLDQGGDPAALALEISERYETELQPHFQAEEEILFPAARSHEPALVDELTAEHRRLESLVDRLRRDVSPAGLRQFTDLLRAHIRKEEDELFERIQKELPRETLDALGEAIDAAAFKVCPRTP